MGISLRKSEQSGVVTLSGTIGLEQLRVMNDYVDLLLDNRVKTIYFDFSNVEGLSVSAVGALSDIRDRVSDHGGRLLLAGVRDDLNRLVPLEHLRRFFNVFDGPLPQEGETDAEAAGPAEGEESLADSPAMTGEQVPDPGMPTSGDGIDSGTAQVEAD